VFIAIIRESSLVLAREFYGELKVCLLRRCSLGDFGLNSGLGGLGIYSALPMDAGRSLEWILMRVTMASNSLQEFLCCPIDFEGSTLLWGVKEQKLTALLKVRRALISSTMEIFRKGRPAGPRGLLKVIFEEMTFVFSFRLPHVETRFGVYGDF
jgi:hypothetical protein